MMNGETSLRGMVHGVWPQVYCKSNKEDGHTTRNAARLFPLSPFYTCLRPHICADACQHSSRRSQVPHYAQGTPAAASEWIAYGEVQTLAVAETRHVVETVLVRQVYAYAPVESQHEEVEVVAYAYARTKRSLLKKFVEAQL